ncbi:MAG: hypothetical protein QOK36_3800 [Gaiellales bacterium]|nr:hypothetical protein [Gaiellales bacterium]
MFSRRRREPPAPGQDAVVDRVLCVSATAMLGAIAAAVAEGTMDGEAAAKYLTESHRWLIRENLASALSARERALLAKPVPEWTQDEVIQANWHNEAIGVLLWAIAALAELLPHDARFERLPSSVPLLASTSGFRGAARLRPPEVIGEARRVAELRHWRARTSQPLDGDGPVHDLDADRYSAVAASAAERHRALNWLVGHAADWDSVPTATGEQSSTVGVPGDSQP